MSSIIPSRSTTLADVSTGGSAISALIQAYLHAAKSPDARAALVALQGILGTEDDDVDNIIMMMRSFWSRVRAPSDLGALKAGTAVYHRNLDGSSRYVRPNFTVNTGWFQLRDPTTNTIQAAMGCDLQSPCDGAHYIKPKGSTVKCVGPNQVVAAGGTAGTYSVSGVGGVAYVVPPPTEVPPPGLVGVPVNPPTTRPYVEKYYDIGRPAVAVGLGYGTTEFLMGAGEMLLVVGAVKVKIAGPGAPETAPITVRNVVVDNLVVNTGGPDFTVPTSSWQSALGRVHSQGFLVQWWRMHVTADEDPVAPQGMGMRNGANVSAFSANYLSEDAVMARSMSLPAKAPLGPEASIIDAERFSEACAIMGVAGVSNSVPL